MKRLLLTVAALSTIFAAFASPVSEQDARQDASSFLAQAKNGTASVKGFGYDNSLHLVKSTESYYIYNIGAGNGFIIVSADSRAQKVLGYSFNGQFNGSDESVKYILSAYSSEIKGIANAKGADVSAAPAKAISHKAVQPLVKTAWSQSSYYNDLCPEVNGRKTKAGCAAIAMAQIVNYNQYPAATSEDIPSYELWSVKVDKTPRFSISWPLTDANGKTIESKKADVSRLVAALGASMKMQYGTSTSSAYNSDVLEAVKKYFGYDNQMRIVERRNFSIASWDAIIYNEIANGRPVYYAGYGEKDGYSERGHAFICDGYDGNGYYHFNFGWGYSNGYYRMSALLASDNQYGYSFNQIAIIGIQKPVADYTPMEASLINDERTDNSSDLVVDSVYDNAFYSGATNKVKIYLDNKGEEFDGSLYLFVDGSLYSAEHTAIAAGGEDSVIMKFETNRTGSLDYKITSDYAGNDVLYDGTLDLHKYTYYGDLNWQTLLEGVDDNGVLDGNELTWTITITNNDNWDEYANTMTISWLNTVTGKVEKKNMLAAVAAGETKTFTFHCSGFAYGRESYVKVDYGCLKTPYLHFTPQEKSVNDNNEITDNNETTDIQTVSVNNESNNEGRVAVYSLNGVRVGTFNAGEKIALNKGIYIVNGKKIVIR